ncbi:MAG: acetate kinase, partial [Thermoanaerobaculia bacterium]
MAFRSGVSVLVLNPGSSTLKFAVYRGDARLAGGTIEHVSSDATAEAIGKAEGASIEAVGIRVVHGGSKLVKPARVDGAVLEEIGRLAAIAPLHNPLAVRVIEDVRRSLGDVPIVAVFDTAFHQTLPAVAATYAVPPELGVRRYG